MRRAFAFAVFLMAATAAATDDFSPRGMVSYESRDTGPAATSYLREELEFVLTRMLSDTFDLRVILGGSHYDYETEFEGRPAGTTRALEFRPNAALSMHFGPVSGEAEYDLRRTSLDTQETDYTTSNENIRVQAGWLGGRYYPGGRVYTTRYSVSDDRFGEDVTNDALYAMFDKSWRTLTVGVGGSLRSDRDERVGYERETTEQLASAAYADAWMDGRVALSAGVAGMVTRMDESTGDTTARLPNFVPIPRVLWGIDDTPLDSTEVSFVPVPALTDNRFDVLTNISLGPEARSFQNFVFDLSVFQTVDQVEVVVRDEERNFVLNGSGVLWDVYTSIDGVRWTPHAETVVAFNPGRSQYEISFRRLEVRWLKVVSFGVAPEPMFVTETRVVFFTEVTSNTSQSDYDNLSVNTALSVTPHRQVRVQYVGAGWFVRQKIGLQPETDTHDVTHLVSGQYDPFRRLGFDARVEYRDAGSARITEESRAWSVGARLTPVDKLQITTFCERRNDQFALVAIEGRLCSASATAQVFPTLDMIVTVSDRDDRFAEDEGRIEARTYTLSANGRLTRSLRVNLNGTSTRTVIAGQVLTTPPIRDDRYNADFDYSAGRALGLGISLGWLAAGERSGLLQRYRIRWNPFGDGAITLTTSYNEDIDPYSDTRAQRLFVSPRWQINSFTALTVTYSTVSLEGERPLDTRQITAALNFFR